MSVTTESNKGEGGVMEICMGALSPKLSEQIIGLPTEYDKDADAITRLFVREIITDSECQRARRRLIKKIEKWSLKAANEGR